MTVLRPEALLVRVTHHGRTVALGLLGQRNRRFLSLRPASLHLNETGDPMRDGMMIEYNGLLTEPGWEEEAAEAFLLAISRNKDLARRDLYLSGVFDIWKRLCLRQGLLASLLRQPQIAPTASLQAIPAGDLLATMTRNSRQQIRRSIRYYEERGPLTLDRAGDAAQALVWLDALEDLHTRSWRHRGKSGAFADSSFKAFHRHLIATSFAEGVPDILRARAGETVLGYLYNFRRSAVVYSYQSGFHYEQESHGRPGLVAHVLAMRLYRSEGMATYKFLAGDARYKNSLANGKEELLWMAARRSTILSRLVRTLADLHGALFRRRPPASDSEP